MQDQLIYVPNFLKEMRELRYLSLPLMGDKTKLELGNLVNLETLENFSTKNSSVRDLDRMTKLRKLYFFIQGKAIETLSSSLSKLRLLENLCISACWLVENPMPILEKLVQLKSLRLWHQSLSGRRMVCSSGGFPQLQELLIQGLDEWEEWIVEEGSMPLLHSLKISDCKKLKKLPDGLSLIYSLKDLRMDKEWKERLSEGGEDYYKVQHIPSVEFY